MDLNKLPSAMTQIIYLTISAAKPLKDVESEAGKSWSKALDQVEQSGGYQRLFWGRSVESPDKVQLHIVRSSLAAHQVWLHSTAYHNFLKVLSPLLNTSVKPVVRHVVPMTTYTSSPTTAWNAPVTGTAIYLRTTSAWHEGAWPCWTHVVRHVTGNSGISGGKLLEPFNPQVSSTLAGISAPPKKGKGSMSNEDIEDCYLVYVGWESIKAHNDYHHTRHFRDHGVILTLANDGWREYGHVKFEGWRGEQAPAYSTNARL